MADLVRYQKDGHLGIVTISRPDVHNALSRGVVNELSVICDHLASVDQLRGVVITGEGDKSFSAGADLKERQGMTEQETLEFVTTIQKTCQKVSELPMPTIAAINGHALGGGLELALACDIRVMAAKASLGLTECSWGIIPGAGGTQRLPRIVGLSRAMDMIFSAKKVDGEHALLYGLVNYLAPDADGVRMLAMKLAQTIANNAPLAVRAAKEALVASLDNTLKDGLVVELASYHEILDSADRKEGLRAFQEKRPPQFRGE